MPDKLETLKLLMEKRRRLESAEAALKEGDMQRFSEESDIETDDERHDRLMNDPTAWSPGV